MQLKNYSNNDERSEQRLYSYCSFYIVDCDRSLERLKGLNTRIILKVLFKTPCYEKVYLLIVCFFYYLLLKR